MRRRHNSKMFWKVYQKDMHDINMNRTSETNANFGCPKGHNINMNRTSETNANFGCPKGGGKSELFYQETYHSQNFRNETLKSPLLKKLRVSLLPHFV